MSATTLEIYIYIFFFKKTYGCINSWLHWFDQCTVEDGNLLIKKNVKVIDGTESGTV